MSLPHTNREMLLSAALDGELSVQEQLEFDRALATDPAFAQEFDELKLLRRELKASLNSLREQRPAPELTDRIVAAAFEQAASQGRHATITPAPIDQDSRSTRRWSRIATGFALAASVLLAVGIWNLDRLGDVNAPRDPQGLAALGPNTGLPPSGSDITASTTVEEPSVVPSEGLAMEQPQVEHVVENEPPKVMGIKPLPGADREEMKGEDPAAAVEPMPSAIASVQPVESESRPSSDDKPGSEVQRQPLSLVLVLAVDLTEEGREQLAIQEALRSADIRIGEDSIVGSQVVAHLRDNQVVQTEADGKPAKLYFIEASTKQIDRLVTRLMTSPQSFASVGLSLAMDPPLLAAVSDLREVDPTKIRQDQPVGFARDIATSEDEGLAFDSQAFAPLDRDMAVSDLLQGQPAADAAPASGDDAPSQLLLLVR